MEKPSVAVLGLGIMGAAMARRLLAAGFELRVWNRSPEKTRPLVEAGARAAASPAEAASGADVVLTILADGQAVEDVVAGADGALAAMAPDSVWLQMSTIGGAWADRLGALAGARVYVDAPVLGTRQPAEKGELVVLASGPDHARPRVAPILEVVGRRTLWVGPAGQGSRLKLVVNNWLVGLVGTLAETLVVARGLGVDPEHFLEAIEGGPLGAPFARIKGQAMLARSFEPSFPLRLALKDVRLVIEAATGAGLQPAVAEAVAGLFQRAADQGHGDADLSAVYDVAGR